MKDGKGWMLVMKIPSTNQDKFFCKDSPSLVCLPRPPSQQAAAPSLMLLPLCVDDSDYWWNNTVVNADDTDLLANKPMIHPFYHSLAVTSIRIAMGSIEKAHEHRLLALGSAQALFTGPEILITNYERKDFTDFFPADRWVGQDNCNERAFQIRDQSGVFCR